ncbi:DUF1559 domain-containing protein [Planctomyces sp. SH-PL62]|uniref:DUF1559 family PulG-like putative transporter n=1 Tax=Planctomyces sp. SH-PL62 TaxID=1636152 RepID=UPI00078D5667|nr:DUF1559 domain-containing protein [Planctomyces sp. SH-PL62]AMV35985.1 hypothetical protein VT85_00975 [Planctomyces sp. SH-PL62]
MSTGFDKHLRPGARRGLTFVEVLVMLAVIALLIALILPLSRSGGRAAVRRAQCNNNLKQIALALSNYRQEHKALPPAYTVDAEGRPLHSWRTLILPYLEMEPLYRKIDLSKPWDDPANAEARETPLSVFRCPESAGPPNTTTYLAIVAPGGGLLPDRPRSLEDVTDSHASTLLVIEAGEEGAVPWMAPTDADEALVMGIGPKTQLHHNGGWNAVFVDGHARFLSATMPAEERRAMITIAGDDGEVVNEL